MKRKSNYYFGVTTLIRRYFCGPCVSKWWDGVGSERGSTKYICTLHEGHDGKHHWEKDKTWDPFRAVSWEKAMPLERSGSHQYKTSKDKR